MKNSSNRKKYTFFTFGHPNIKATHVKTLEFTKDDFLTERGDCIIGIKSNFDSNKLKQFSGKIKIICEIENEDGAILTSEFKSKVSEDFSSEDELVFRKSGFKSDRTFGVGLNRGANRLDREIVEVMKSEKAQMRVTIVEGWY